jgi:hypothetical protein
MSVPPFSFRPLAGNAGDLAQRTMVKASAFRMAESRQRKNPNPPRVLLEGGGGLGFFTLATVTYQDTSVCVV